MIRATLVTQVNLAILAALAVAIPLACASSEGERPRAEPAHPAAEPVQPAAEPVQPATAGEHPWRPEDPVVQLINRGVAAMERYEYPEAVDLFEKASALEPGRRDARVNLAIALFNRGGREDIARSVETLDALLAQDARDARAAYVRAMIHQYSGEDDTAVALLETAVELEPHDAYAWYMLARSKGNLGDDATEDLERAIAENPNLVSAYFKLVQAAVRGGNRERAAALRKKFSELQGSAVADTVVAPEYHRMGPLSLVTPPPATSTGRATSSEVRPGASRVLWEGRPLTTADAVDGAASGRGETSGPAAGGGRPSLAFADVDGDGRLDLATNVPSLPGGGIRLFLAASDGTLRDATEASGLGGVGRVLSIAFGDHDNDDIVDMFLACDGPNRLFRGRGDGTFQDVTASTGTEGPGEVESASAIFLDADHDSDLDIYVSNRETEEGAPAPNQLLNNNGDGTFSDIAAAGGVACPEDRSLMAVPVLLDGDRDADLIVFNEGTAPRVFLNEREGRYQERADIVLVPGSGGVAQDFDGDGRADLLVLPRGGRASLGREGSLGAQGALNLRMADGSLEASAQFAGVIDALGTWGPISWMRVLDVDLDGDLDILAAGGGKGHALLNDGLGRFALRPGLWESGPDAIAEEVIDIDGDGAAEIVRVSLSAAGLARIEAVPLAPSPRPGWIAVFPTGHRGVDKRTRSPASGYGTRIEVRLGLHAQAIQYTGVWGGRAQSAAPVVFGLGGALGPEGEGTVDHVAFLWPDGVTQSEASLAAGRVHRIQELERRVASCPVLFAWDGERFDFVTDFAGVGGLGYFLAPGDRAKPQVREHVKIEPGKLRPRDGRYEIRVTEPMEEVAYVDRLELVAVDHPEGSEVVPDERLAVTGPPPTGRLLHVRERVFARAAVAEGTAGDGTAGDPADCAGWLRDVDRRYACPPVIDRRFVGFARPHALVLDFGLDLEPLASAEGVHLFITGSLEYPYSQTTYAARQAGLTWQAIRVDRQVADGPWETIVPDAGAPAGMGRTMAVDLTGLLACGELRLRLATNVEILYDRVFVARDEGEEGLVVRAVPLEEATLRRLGFPIEVSPDGREPPIYSYDVIEAASAFKIPRGRYTRYGPVRALLDAFDDRYVILGSGDEIAVRFDATAVGEPAPGSVRSFVVISHAYAKDMDLYTAEPDTVEPLPFAAMSAYPYPPGESYPDGEEYRRYRREYNTRLEGAAEAVPLSDRVRSGARPWPGSAGPGSAPDPGRPSGPPAAPSGPSGSPR